MTDFVILERAASGGQHLAGQHLPRVRLRHPVASVLVLVRAEPRLGAQLLPAAGDLALPGRDHRPLRPARPSAARAEVTGARWDPGLARWKLLTTRCGISTPRGATRHCGPAPHSGSGAPPVTWTYRGTASSRREGTTADYPCRARNCGISWAAPSDSISSSAKPMLKADLIGRPAASPW